jgi:hypothetical protein
VDILLNRKNIKVNMQIENWNNLTEQQKEEAKNQLELIQNNNNKKINEDSISFFKNNHYLVIKKIIDVNLANFLYLYIKNSALRCDFMENTFGENNYDKSIYGSFDDWQSFGDYSKYGGATFDTLADGLKNNIENMIDLKLLTTYSYHRLYTTNSELEIHKDRKSCEISATLCLGYDISNIDSKKHPNWNWPMFIKDKNNNEIPVHMNPGDMIIYRGCKVEHWREPFWGKNQAQVFLHYNEKQGNFDVPFDGRPALGLPVYFRSKEYDQKLEELNKKVYGEQLKYDSETKNKKIIY